MTEDRYIEGDKQTTKDYKKKTGDTTQVVEKADDGKQTTSYRLWKTEHERWKTDGER